MDVAGLRDLIQKYTTAGPRYTSYPTAPHWRDGISEVHYRDSLSKLAKIDVPIAMYVHVPFCEALCYYCGCNIHITKDKPRALSYVDSLKKEIEWTATAIASKKSLGQISFGGGTPTFLSSGQLTETFKAITGNFDIAPDAEVSIEIDPRVTTEEQLKTLRSLGFNRVSFGVQDFDPKVQEAVNRIQSLELTSKLLYTARDLGFTGINLDFIYGLPYQSVASFKHTLDHIAALKPDRIALYNYAHLPSLRPHQKILDKLPMPNADERLEIFLLSFEALQKAGYLPIGMDHFALENDELAKAVHNGKLYRNFMGYTVKNGAALLGIGASAIGEVSDGFFQNLRETKPYEEAVANAGTAVFRGMKLSADDMLRKAVIQALMCRFRVEFDAFGVDFHSYFEKEMNSLQPFVNDKFIEIDSRGISVTSVGRLFVRNIAMTFDAYLGTENKPTYSKTL